MKNLGLYLVIALGFGIYGYMTEADRDETGAIVDGGRVDAFEIKQGDCFDDSSSMTEVSNLPGRPCSEPHDNEAYAVVNLTMSEYPEGDAMAEIAFDRCMEQFEPFVGLEYESSSLDIFTLYPSPESWQQSDREVVCAVYDMEANKLIGSVQGRGI